MLVDMIESGTTANSAVLPPDGGEFEQARGLKPCAAGIKIDADGTVYSKSNDGVVWQAVGTWLLVGANTGFWLSRTIDSGSLNIDASANSPVITDVTKANPGVVTATAHGFENTDTVTISGVLGMTELNGNTYTVANKADNTFQLSGINTTGFTTYVSDGVAAANTLVCNTDRIYSISNPAIGTTKTVVLTLELSNDGSGSPIIASQQYNIEADLS